MEAIFKDELVNLLRNGLIVTVVIMAIFRFIKLPESIKPSTKEIISKLIILATSFFIVWLLREIEGTRKELIAYYLFTTSFSVLFYEFAGKYLVKGWFKKYRGADLKVTNKDN